MKQGRDILRKRVISLSSGSNLGTIEDLYLGASLERIAGLYVGSEGSIFNRTSCMIAYTHVDRLGEDAVLVDSDDAVQSARDIAQTALWTRLSELRGRPVDTTGGTHIGKVDDVIVADDGQVLGYRLSDIAVQGPVAQKRAIALDTILDLGHGDGIMTIDLSKAEQQELTLA